MGANPSQESSSVQALGHTNIQHSWPESTAWPGWWSSQKLVLPSAGITLWAAAISICWSEADDFHIL